MTDIDRISRHCASLLIENENLKIRIEKLEAALREIDAVKYYGMEGAEMECKEMHDIARKALEGKDDVG
jgi:regulator of replication initiation timing